MLSYKIVVILIVKKLTLSVSYKLYVNSKKGRKKFKKKGKKEVIDKTIRVKESRKENSRGVVGWEFGESMFPDVLFRGVTGWGFCESKSSDVYFEGVAGWGFGELISDECGEVFPASDFLKKIHKGRFMQILSIAKLKYKKLNNETKIRTLIYIFSMFS